MLAEFIELAEQDNKPLGTVYINPSHVTRVRPVKNNGEAVEVSIITDVNKVSTRVEGRASQVRSTLQNPR